VSDDLRDVPAVAGLPIERVEGLLARLGFAVAKRPEESERITPGHVIAIDPPPGSRVPAGATVTLRISVPTTT
jgi:beta-lactam-binding protein with PASTA domain